MAEAGVANFETGVWHGLYAPKGTPKDIIETLAKALREAVRDPNVKSKFADLGSDPVPLDQVRPEALRAHLKSEVERWSVVIRAAGVYAD